MTPNTECLQVGGVGWMAACVEWDHVIDLQAAGATARPAAVAVPD